MNGFEKMGEFPFINIVCILSLLVGVQAQLGHAFQLSCNLENTIFFSCNENGDALLVTRLLKQSLEGKKQM